MNQDNYNLDAFGNFKNYGKLLIQRFTFLEWPKCYDANLTCSTNFNS